MKSSIIDVIVNGRKEAKLFCFGSQLQPITVFLVYLDEHRCFAGGSADLSGQIKNDLLKRYGADAKLCFKRSVASKEERLQKKLVAAFKNTNESA